MHSAFGIAEIESRPIQNPISVDGVATLEEWGDCPAVTLSDVFDTRYFFRHTESVLYVLIDNVGDISDNWKGGVERRDGSWLLQKPIGDYFNLWFDVNQNQAWEVGDTSYSIFSFTDYGGVDPKDIPVGTVRPELPWPALIKTGVLSARSHYGVSYTNPGFIFSHINVSSDPTMSSYARGFGPTPSDAKSHRFFEVAIPRSEIGGMGETVHFKSFAPGGDYNIALSSTSTLTFDELVERYDGFGYDFNGYVDPKDGCDGTVVPGVGLGCSGFVSVVMQRLAAQEEWKVLYKKTVHQSLGTTLTSDQLQIGDITFTPANVANASLVFGAGIAERLGLGASTAILAKSLVKGDRTGLVAGQLYFFDVQRWKTTSMGKVVKWKTNDKGGLAPAATGKYIREGHTGFVRPGSDGSMPQWQYSETNDGLRTDDFLTWLTKSKYSPSRSSNKSQKGKIKVTFAPVAEPPPTP